MSLSSSIAKSSIAMLAIKFFHRSIGLISILVLSRLLTPEDFGIVALATVIVFFCDILTETGLQQYIVNKETISDEDLNTAFTLNLILKSIIALFFIAISGFVADFFEQENLGEVIIVIVVLLPVSALANPGVNIYKRELNYRPIMNLLMTEKIASFVVTIGLAIYFKNYWAMVLGILVSYTYKSIYSYFIHSYRPRLSLSQVKAQWGFSKWMLLKGVVGYTKSEFDTFIVSKLFSIEAVGGFSLMKNISTIPGRELIRPVTEPLLAAFSKDKQGSEDLSYKVLHSLIVLLTVTLPIAAFLFFFSELIVRLLFNEQWWSYSPILAVLSVLIINYSFVSVLQEALTAIRKLRFMFYYDLTTLIVLVSILVNMGIPDIKGFADIRVTIAALSVFPLIIYSFFVLRVNFKYFFGLIAVLIVSTALAITLSKVVVALLSMTVFFELLTAGVIYFLIYLCGILTLLSLVKADYVAEYRRVLYSVLGVVWRSLSNRA